MARVTGGSVPAGSSATSERAAAMQQQDLGRRPQRVRFVRIVDPLLEVLPHGAVQGEVTVRGAVPELGLEQGTDHIVQVQPDGAVPHVRPGHEPGPDRFDLVADGAAQQVLGHLGGVRAGGQAQAVGGARHVVHDPGAQPADHVGGVPEVGDPALPAAHLREQHQHQRVPLGQPGQRGPFGVRH
ncbi:MAG: hypothetical protein KBG85_08345, partial [Micropruina sp.]|nr:hypothetical protein [Micropruina sp.]